MPEAKYNPKRREIEGAQEALEEGSLPSGWSARLMDRIVYGDRKVHPSMKIKLNSDENTN